MSNKRIRGVAVHRAILIGSTSTPLSAAEKLMAPPDHTHKWTVAVRSAASHPLPSTSAVSNKADDPASSAPAASASTTATISTRGRDQEMDYHKMVGGRDDISHFIKRVRFKLHDTYAQPTRNIDKPPFSVTETGWGEFEIQVKIFFVPEANEKPVTAFHHLKLHPWVKVVPSALQPNPAAPAPAALEATGTDSATTAEASATVTTSTDANAGENIATGEQQDPTVASEETSAKDDMEVDPPMEGPPAVPSEQPAATSLAASAAPPVLPPVVHSWQFDEIVFPEPTEAFYEILTAHPPTPFPATSAQAFADPAAYRSYQSAVEEAAKQGAENAQPPAAPPHPLHSSSGFLFDAMSQEAQQGEADRLDLARISAVKELEKGREELIKTEKALKEIRSKLSVLNVPAPSNGTNVATSSS